MSGLGISISVKHDYGAGTADVGEISPRLVGKWRDATEDSTNLLRGEVVRLVGARTSISAEVAEEITESSFERTPLGARGEVEFKAAPRWIYPRTKKALAFEIDGQRIVRRRVRGSRPYKLLGRAADSSGPAIETVYEEKVREVLD